MLARNLLILATAVLVVAAASCTSSNIDDGDSANVVLEVDQVQLAIITSTFDPLFNVCVFELTESTATLSNVPKSETAISQPFNDILIDRMVITYQWDDGLVMPPFETSPRVVIPAAGTNQVRFLAVQLQEFFAAVPSRDGHSAEVTLQFFGEVADGSTVQATGGGPLFVNACFATSGP